MGLFTQEEFNDIQRSLEAMTNWFNNKMTKPDNNAPKSIKGDYDLSIHGNKIVLVDNVDGTTVEAKCHPDDDFDIGIGITEAFKKLNVKREEIRKQKEEEEKKIKVGDCVEVVDCGESYCTKVDFFENEDTAKYAPYFRYGVVPQNGMFAKVVFVDKNRDLFLIEARKESYYGPEEYKELNCHYSTYLMNSHGLRKVANPDV